MIILKLIRLVIEIIMVLIIEMEVIRMVKAIDIYIWLYMFFNVITIGATIGIHSDRRASSSRINVVLSSRSGRLPSSSSPTVRSDLLFLA